MELKMNYQYTYFIHPFVINENKYQKYIMKMLKDKRFSIKTIDKQKDIDLFRYFLPKISEYMFSNLSKIKIEKLEKMPIDTKSAILSKNECTIFQYNLVNDIQGKAEEKGIFFKVHRVELVCFNTGICFLCMKTNIENGNDFSDLLNFNYKFRDVNQEYKENYDKIYLQTSTFDNVNKLTEFIKDITGSNIEAIKLNIDTQRFLTYSYVCIDQEAWNEEKNFENIKYNFIKYANLLPADNSANLEEETKSFSKWKYAKIGITKQGVTLFTSNADINNFTTLPHKFETEYFYTYIINLYKKIYLKKLEREFRQTTKFKKVVKKFIEFTKNLWIQEVTEDEIGTYLNCKISEELELDRLYYEIKTKYDIFYKNFNIEKNTKIVLFITVILSIALIFNILNYINLLK